MLEMLLPSISSSKKIYMPRVSAGETISAALEFCAIYCTDKPSDESQMQRI